MTEQNSLTRGYASDELNEDDPLEELARIVSGENKPARRPAASAAEAHPQEAAYDESAELAHDLEASDLEAGDLEAGDDELSFDLESELMRELAGPPAGHPAWQQSDEYEQLAAADAGEPSVAEEDAERLAGDGDERLDTGEDEFSLEDRLLAELGLSESDDRWDEAEDELAVEAEFARHEADAGFDAADAAEVGDEPAASFDEEEGGEIDLQREFQETLEAELAVGRAASALNRAAEEEAEEFAAEIEEPWAETTSYYDEPEAGYDEPQPDHASHPEAEDADSDESSLHTGHAPTSEPGEAADELDDLDFDEAFQTELSTMVVDEMESEEIPAAATPAQYSEHEDEPAQDPDSGFDSERSLEDHFAAAFAEELEFADPRGDTRAADPFAKAGAAPVSWEGGNEADPTGETPDAAASEIDDSDDSVAFDATLEETPPPLSVLRQGRMSRKSFRLAGVALGAALIIGLGVVSYGFFKGETVDSGPIVVKADDEPVKIRPEDPGGAKVANQDKAAYERVSGKFDEETTQEKLVSGVEEPVAIPAANAAAISAESGAAVPSGQAATVGKVEERLVPKAPDGASVAALPTLQPRRVRTLTVRADGTIVPPPAESSGARTASAFAPTGGDAADSIDGARSTGEIPVPLPNPAEGGAPGAAPASRVDPVNTQSAAPEQSAEAPIALATRSAAGTDAAPAASEQPKEPATQVARSEWAVQVSSQKSAEDAQASYVNLRNRFPELLEGRQMAVQRAEVDGKGVFFRVRVQADSREDAIAFCDRLKAAGGSCFATR